LAHRFLAACAILALPAADKTRFFTVMTSFPAELPNAFAAALTPLNCRSNLLTCFSSFLSSRLIAARMFMNPPGEIYLNQGRGTRCTAALLAGAGYAITVDELFERVG
jgi:hypothetical protein